MVVLKKNANTPASQALDDSSLKCPISQRLAEAPLLFSGMSAVGRSSLSQLRLEFHKWLLCPPGHLEVLTSPAAGNRESLLLAAIPQAYCCLLGLLKVGEWEGGAQQLFLWLTSNASLSREEDNPGSSNICLQWVKVNTLVQGREGETMLYCIAVLYCVNVVLHCFGQVFFSGDSLLNLSESYCSFVPSQAPAALSAEWALSPDKPVLSNSLLSQSQSCCSCASLQGTHMILLELIACLLWHSCLSTFRKSCACVCVSGSVVL